MQSTAGPGRMAWSSGEERQLLEFLVAELRAANANAMAPTGNELWLLAQAKRVTQHSYSSMQTKMRKKLLPGIQMGTLAVCRLLAEADVRLLQRSFFAEATYRDPTGQRRETKLTNTKTGCSSNRATGRQPAEDEVIDLEKELQLQQRLEKKQREKPRTDEAARSPEKQMLLDETAKCQSPLKKRQATESNSDWLCRRTDQRQTAATAAAVPGPSSRTLVTKAVVRCSPLSSFKEKAVQTVEKWPEAASPSASAESKGEMPSTNRTAVADIFYEPDPGDDDELDQEEEDVMEVEEKEKGEKEWEEPTDIGYISEEEMQKDYCPKDIPSRDSVLRKLKLSHASQKSSHGSAEPDTKTGMEQLRVLSEIAIQYKTPYKAVMQYVRKYGNIQKAEEAVLRRKLELHRRRDGD